MLRHLVRLNLFVLRDLFFSVQTKVDDDEFKNHVEPSQKGNNKRDLCFIEIRSLYFSVFVPPLVVKALNCLKSSFFLEVGTARAATTEATLALFAGLRKIPDSSI
jgi:hypothetical protein